MRAKKEKHFQNYDKISKFLNNEKKEKRDERRKQARDYVVSDYREH